MILMIWVLSAVTWKESAERTPPPPTKRKKAMEFQTASMVSPFRSEYQGAPCSLKLGYMVPNNGYLGYVYRGWMQSLGILMVERVFGSL